MRPIVTEHRRGYTGVRAGIQMLVGCGSMKCMALTGSMTAATPASQDALHALLRDVLPPPGGMER